MASEASATTNADGASESEATTATGDVTGDVTDEVAATDAAGDATDNAAATDAAGDATDDAAATGDATDDATAADDATATGDATATATDDATATGDATGEVAAMDEVGERGPARRPVAVGLLNVTGLSLGYLYLRRWRRAVVFLVATAGLVAVAFVDDAAHRPWLWRGIFAAWLGWLALDGWWLAHWHPGARTAPRRRPVLVASAAVLAVVAGYLAYGVAADRTYEAGERAQAAGDCQEATRRFDLVTGPFELALSGTVAAAERGREYCSQFMVAVRRQDRGEFEGAITGYQEFLERTPANPLDGPAHDRIQRAHLDWARSVHTTGDFNAAIRIYRGLLADYGDAWSTKDARSELAQTYLDQAKQLRSKFDPAGGEAAVYDVRRAVQNYLTIGDELADTPAAAEVPEAIVDTFNEAIRPFTDGAYCPALPILEYFVGLPEKRSAGVLPTARQNHGVAAFECGVQRYAAAAFDEALEHFETVTSKYPDHSTAPAARSAVIAATIAVEQPGTVPPLPAPLGDNEPGAISLIFWNDTSVPTEVLVSGPTAHRFVIPGCDFCPEAYDNEADACVSMSGRPRFQLRLRPGTYYAINRDAEDPGGGAGLITINLSGSEIYCLYRGPLAP